jgi:predicted dehydrogenase
MEKIKLGVLGYGNIGTLHVDNVISGKCPQVEISAICDIDPEKRALAKEKTPNAQIFENAEDMINSGKIDSILVAVPHYDHPKYAIVALKVGIHTLIE